jgi:hypothetical protein
MRKAMSDGAADLLTATTVPRISGRDCQDERMRECAKDASMSDDFEAQRLCAKSAVMSTDLEGATVSDDLQSAAVSDDFEAQREACERMRRWFAEERSAMLARMWRLFAEIIRAVKSYAEELWR